MSCTVETPSETKQAQELIICADQIEVLAAAFCFRDQVKRRLAGELTEDEFKMLRLMNGVYLQLHAYMFRVAIPYGTLSSPQLRKMAHVARRYDRGYGHFTTRQNIQFNWIKLADLPDAWKISLRSASTRCRPRAIACAMSPPINGPVSRRARSRIRASGRNCCGSIRPCIRNSRSCRASSRSRSRRRPMIARRSRCMTSVCEFTRTRPANWLRSLVGGGLGRTPFIGKVIKPFVHGRDILSYVESILRVYNQYGRRDNIYKARIKILVHELGIEKFAAEVEDEWLATRESALTLDNEVVEDIRSRFSYPHYQKLPTRRTSWRRVGRSAFCALAQELGRAASGARLRHRDIVAEAGRRPARRCHGRPDGCGRRSCRQIFVRRNPRGP
jgi:sulfite reductase (NADPH) hemoprotein beta-component